MELSARRGWLLHEMGVMRVRLRVGHTEKQANKQDELRVDMCDGWWQAREHR